jgi:hypothetical protein
MGSELLSVYIGIYLLSFRFISKLHNKQVSERESEREREDKKKDSITEGNVMIFLRDPFFPQLFFVTPLHLVTHRNVYPSPTKTSLSPPQCLSRVLLKFFRDFGFIIRNKERETPIVSVSHTLPKKPVIPTGGSNQ